MSLKCPCFLFAIHSLPLERFHHSTYGNKLQDLLSKKFIAGYNFEFMFAHLSAKSPIHSIHGEFLFYQRFPSGITFRNAHGRRQCE